MELYNRIGGVSSVDIGRHAGDGEILLNQTLVRANNGANKNVAENGS